MVRILVHPALIIEQRAGVRIGERSPPGASGRPRSFRLGWFGPDRHEGQGFGDPHFPGVVAELLAAIEARHVGLNMTWGAPSDRCDRTGQMFMPAAKEQIYNVVDHFASLIRGIRLYQFMRNAAGLWLPHSNYSVWVSMQRFRFSGKNPKVYQRYGRTGPILSPK